MTECFPPGIHTVRTGMRMCVYLNPTLLLLEPWEDARARRDLDFNRVRVIEIKGFEWRFANTRSRIITQKFVTNLWEGLERSVENPQA